MSRSLLPGAIAAALLISGCSGYRGIESANQPVVQRTDYAIDLATSGDTLAAGEASRFAGWLASLRAQYGDDISVDDPTGSVGVRRAIADEASTYGLAVSDAAPVTAGAVTPGTVRVLLSRSSASVPDCPNHSNTAAPTFAALTSSNYGCAVNSNLAAMVARPQDLVRGQPGATTADPATAVKAIGTYRKAPPTGATGLKSEAVGSK